MSATPSATTTPDETADNAANRTVSDIDAFISVAPGHWEWYPSMVVWKGRSTFPLSPGQCLAKPSQDQWNVGVRSGASSDATEVVTAAAKQLKKLGFRIVFQTSTSVGGRSVHDLGETVQFTANKLGTSVFVNSPCFPA